MTAIDSTPQSARTASLFLALILLAGLLLRIAAAMGGVWTDEAWSVLYADEAGGPLGVLTAINHDNNHHINSWWLQLVGPDASSLAMRALAIGTSTATIGVAALIGRRRGRFAALFTALLFAVSPIMVLYGSEARGYAPMLLAFMLALWMADGWLMRGEGPFPVFRFALLAAAGALAHLLMIPALLLLAIGVWLALVDRHRLREGSRRAVQVMAPAVIAGLAVAVLVIFMAAADPAGLRVGGYTPFGVGLFGQALAELAALTTGTGPVAGSGLGVAGVLALTLALPLFWPASQPRHRAAILLVLACFLPLTVLLLQPGNAQFARYYLPVAVAWLLLAGDWTAAAIRRRGAARIAAAAVLTIIVTGSLWMDHRLITNGRGDGGRPVATIAALSPGGARVHINIERARALLVVSARQAAYPLSVTASACPVPGFAFIERERAQIALGSVTLCGVRFIKVAAADAIGPSGQSWTLYQKAPLPTPKPAVNSAPPRR